RYRTNNSNQKPLERTQNWIKLGGKVSRSAIYRDLQKLGFSFADIVKYNDYHSDEGPAAPLMVRNAFQDKEAYFDTLKNAYLSFYLRKDFVSEYESLVANGY
ncbi:hypothetical protein CPT32_31175, partial [Rhizobium sophoriradicis]